MKISKEVKNWMKQWAGDYEDPKTGEYNPTKMAEDAAYRFDLYEGRNYDIPEELFEYAYELCERLER